MVGIKNTEKGDRRKSCVCTHAYAHTHTHTQDETKSLEEAIQHISGPEEWLGLERMEGRINYNISNNREERMMGG